jgi:hypothetical protein
LQPQNRSTTVAKLELNFVIPDTILVFVELGLAAVVALVSLCRPQTLRAFSLRHYFNFHVRHRLCQCGISCKRRFQTSLAEPVAHFFNGLL